MRRGMAGAGSSDGAPIAVTQRGEADVNGRDAAVGSVVRTSRELGDFCSGSSDFDRRRNVDSHAVMITG